MAYEFHYTPTGTGAISGTAVLEQTEDAINDLGNTAISGIQEALDKAEQAFTNSANAVDDAQTALNTANNAEGVAIQAQTDVSNLSGTVTNIGNRVTTAEGNITNLQGRMTTAEGNIGNLQGRMTTAEGNIGNLQTAVSTAQATANSAQQTATTARQQSYVFRYSSTALVASSTNSNTLLDNTDNLKVGDKVIDSSGVLFSVTAIDTANSTFTIGTALIDLAQDSDVVHTNEINSSGIGIIEAVKEVGRVDFNTLTTQGLYGTNASGSTNNPENSPCVVQVIKRLNGVIQIANVFSSSYKSRYIRYCADITAQSPVWQSWIKFATDSDVVHKSGNETISGNKTFSSINGVEPSSLSLPSGNVSDVIDISSYITALDGTSNSYTVPANGWISIAVVGTAIAIVSSSWSDSRLRASSGNVSMLYPVLKNETLDISVMGTTLAYARFIPCQGNV